MLYDDRKKLYAKFDRDIAKRSRIMRLALVCDQMINVLLWNGSQDETISSHIHRRMEAGRALWIEKVICRGLNALERSHCFKSRGE